MEIAEIIARVVPGGRVLASAPLTGGVSAQVDGVDVETAAGAREVLVVRRHRAVAGKPPPADRATREFAALTALHSRGVAVPRPRLFLEPSTLVMDRVPGSTDLPAAPERAMGEALAAIHAVPIALVAELSALPIEDDPLPALRQWLPALPADRLGCGAYLGPAVLLHGDFWSGNLLWQGDALVAVLDWEDVCRGDPHADLACARLELARLRGDDAALRLTEVYGSHCAVDAARLRWWDLFVATAQLEFLDSWGLPPADTASRRDCARRWQARALVELELPGPH